jgi:hypothetical protein
MTSGVQLPEFSEKSLAYISYGDMTYIGNIKNDLPHGNGKMLQTTKCKKGKTLIYEGEWVVTSNIILYIS